MAGDWIKLEHATLDKPEIARIADLLNISTDAALGLVIRFWVWADRNSRDGRVTHMYSRGAESVMRCPGFVAAMTDVGWLSIDDETGVLTIPNYEVHNSSSAKSRALHKDRQKEYRDARVTFKPSPEKRREEVLPLPSASSLSETQRPSGADAESSKKNGTPHPKATRLARDWQLPDDWRDWAVTVFNLDPQRAVRISLAFRDYWIAKPGADGCKLDWQATWRNWIRKEVGDA